MNYNFEQLRADIINSIGTAGSFFPMAMSEISDVENASDQKLLYLAQNYGINPDDYIF